MDLSSDDTLLQRIYQFNDWIDAGNDIYVDQLRDLEPFIMTLPDAEIQNQVRDMFADIAITASSAARGLAG